jgi:endonuclease/exonuclease/phosphatase family metal-dependent hydrolase
VVTVLFATWNVQSGGFAGYVASDYPERLPDIVAGVQAVGAEAMGLVDTWRWKERFSADDLCRRFGYARAFSIDINCRRVDPQIGLTMLTNLTDARFRVVSIGSRDAIVMTNDIRGAPVQTYLVYLDDLEASTRDAQAAALRMRGGAANSVIMGDLNALRTLTSAQRLAGRFMRQRWLRLIFDRFGATGVSYALMSLGGVYGGDRVIEALRAAGFDDIGDPCTPTAYPQVGPLRLQLAVDYILTRGLPASDYRVWDLEGSDHRIVSARLG